MKNTSNEAMQNHLCEMMERLLDDELFQDKEKAEQELKRASVMSELVSTSLEMQKVENQKNEILVNAMDIAGKWNYHITDWSKLSGTLKIEDGAGAKA